MIFLTIFFSLSSSKRSRRDWHEGGGQERIGSRLPNRAQSEYHPRNRKSSDSRSRNRALSQNRQPRRITNIEALIEEARKARLDKQVIFDLSKRSKFEVLWFYPSFFFVLKIEILS